MAEWWKDEFTLTLVGRAVREAGRKAHPGYRDRKVERPLVICGLPRTGTTALHKLLSLDPQFQGLNHWLTTWPMSRSPRAHWLDELGYRSATQALERRMMYTLCLVADHEIFADDVDECLVVLSYDFVSNRFASMPQLPAYDAWLQAQDETPCYRRRVDTLRLIGINNDRTWLLKNPGHFAEMAALLAALTDARAVITHRDPIKSIGSLMSHLANLQRCVNPDIDLRKTAERELTYWSRAM